MGKWSPLRRAIDDMKPNRPMSRMPSIMKVIFDEIKNIKSEIKKMKKKK